MYPLCHHIRADVNVTVFFHHRHHQNQMGRIVFFCCFLLTTLANFPLSEFFSLSANFPRIGSSIIIFGTLKFLPLRYERFILNDYNDNVMSKNKNPFFN